MSFDATAFLQTEAGRLAYRQTDGETGKAGLVWFGGLKSDMLGGKATAVHAAAIKDGRSCLRFDYTGHGESDIAFEKTTVTDWRRDALAMIDAKIDGPQIFIGSSMGGWMSLLAALARPEKVKGLVLIAPAPDFTEKLMWAGFSRDIKDEIETTGQWMRPSPYDDGPYPITKALIESGRDWLITDNPIDLDNIPVRILQGVEDDAVPWRYALDLMDKITSDDMQYHLIKDGDHRLSRDQDVDLLVETVLKLANQVDAAS